MAVYKIDGNTVTLEELEAHLKFEKAKTYLASINYRPDTHFRGVPLASFSVEQLCKIIQDLKEPKASA